MVVMLCDGYWQLVFTMKILPLLLGLPALLAATPTQETIKVCMYLYKKYPQYLAFNPTGAYSLLTLDNAATWTEINEHYWNVQNSLEYQSACTFFPATAQQVSDAVVQLNDASTVPFGLKVSLPAPLWRALGKILNAAASHQPCTRGIDILQHSLTDNNTRAADTTQHLVSPPPRTAY